METVSFTTVASNKFFIEEQNYYIMQKRNRFHRVNLHELNIVRKNIPRINIMSHYMIFWLASAKELFAYLSQILQKKTIKVTRTAKEERSSCSGWKNTEQRMRIRFSVLTSKDKVIKIYFIFNLQITSTGLDTGGFHAIVIFRWKRILF